MSAANIGDAVFRALEIVVLERLDTGLFRLLGEAPAWYQEAGLPQPAEPGVAIDEVFPFLATFLEDATRFWTLRRAGAMHSDSWLEKLPGGRRRPLGATALCAGRRRVLLIAPRSPQYEELRGAVQKMREKGLAVERLERDTARLSSENRDLAARSLEIARLNELKSEYLAGMSHELRTPLHAIIGFSKLLTQGRAGALNPRQKDFVGQVLEAAGHLLSLINDVLDWSRIEAGHLKLDREVFDLKPLVDEVLGAVLPLAAANSLTLSFDGRASRAVLADPRRIRQILYNLLSNAIKFTPAGGSVHLSAETSDDGFVLEVADTGVGIPPGEQGAVFDKFYQVRGGRSGEGSGLGLAITRALVEAHGGSIVVDSEPGRGSRFRVAIPQGTP